MRTPYRRLHKLATIFIYDQQVLVAETESTFNIWNCLEKTEEQIGIRKFSKACVNLYTLCN